MADAEYARNLEAIFKSDKGLHRHCYTCYNQEQCRKPNKSQESCEWTKCANKCGATFHSCKSQDHQNVCLNVTVPCVSQSLGCPIEMTRKEINAHLIKCPASVVVCMAEWNRWPVYTVQRRRHIPFKQFNPYGNEGQLDYDLTLRDQRMLENLNHIPRKTKLSLRNNLTKKFPAVPVPSARFLDKTKNDKDFIDLGLIDPYIGARKVEKNESLMKQWETDMNARLKAKGKTLKKYWEFPELEKGNIHKHCAYCHDLKCPQKFKDNEIEACSVIECRWKCGANYHSCKSGEHYIICPNYIEEDEFEWMLKGVTNLDMRFHKMKQEKKANALKESIQESSDFFQGR